MKNICLCFQIHQPYRLRKYPFFDIGADSGGDYENIHLNSEVFDDIAKQSYIPANELMLELLNNYPDFRLSYVISGLAIEQMEDYGASLIESFQALAKTGRVDFILEPYAHSVAAIYNADEFKRQVEQLEEKILNTFDIKPTKVLCNPELIYSGDIANVCQKMGLKAIFADGNRPFLGGRSANKIYTSEEANKLKVLFRNSYLSDLIENKFSRYDVAEYPITADKILSKAEAELNEGETVVLYLNYETLGKRHHRDTGIFEFFRALPDVASRFGLGFTSPSLLIKKKAEEKIAAENVSSILADDNCVNPWKRNPLQRSVIEKLRETCEHVELCQNRDIQAKWLVLQSIDQLFYMDTSISSAFSPHGSAYEAYTNYMNVFSDFLLRLAAQFPEDYREGISSYERTIQKQSLLISEQKEEISVLKRIISDLELKK